MKVHGNGSISPLESKSRYKCRKWRLYVSTECGVKTRVIHGTWTNAQSALAAFIGELCDKIPNSETFQAYAASWLLWREKSGDFAPGTLANDRRDLAALNRSELAGMALEDITPQTCRDCLLWIKTHPVRKAGELSNTTMNSIHTTLAAILRQAVDDKRLQASPMEHIKPPKPDTKERAWMTPEQLMQFVHSLESLPLDGRVMALYFMALCGLRRGEACAVKSCQSSQARVRLFSSTIAAIAGGAARRHECYSIASGRLRSRVTPWLRSIRPLYQEASQAAAESAQRL